MQERWKSKAAWATLGALIVMLLGTFGVYERLGITSDTVQQIIDTVLATAVAFGILNNPTDRTGF